MEQDTKKSPIPQIVLERALLGELEQKELEQWQNHPDFEEKLMKLKESNEAILQQYPSQFFSQEVKNRYERQTKASYVPPNQKPSLFKRFLLNPIPTMALLIGALFLGILVPQLSYVDDGAEIANLPEDDIRLKGSEPKIAVYLERQDEVINLKSGDQVRSFDSVQIAYQSGGKSYGSILSVDGRGSVTLHFPESFNGSTQLDQGGEILLPYAYQLDDAPSFETFYFVSSDQYFDVRQLFNNVKENLIPGEQPGTILPDILGEVLVSTFHLRK